MSAGKTEPNQFTRRGLWVINEHFESNVNAVRPGAIVFSRLDRSTCGRNHTRARDGSP